MRLAFLIFIFLTSLSISCYYFWNSYFTDPTNAASLKNVIKNYGVFCVGEERADTCYWFNNNGILTDKADTIVGNFLRINEVSDYELAINTQFLDDYLWENMLIITDFLGSEKLDFKNVMLSRNDQEVVVTTNKNQTIIFSLRFNPQNNIIGLLSSLEKNKMKNASWIDLRVENKIFYK